MNYKYILVTCAIMLILDYIYLSITKNSFIKMVVDIQNSPFKFNII